jgi:hypothetical protein
MSVCVVCERKTSGSLEFCKTHYNEYKSDILEKKPWIRAMKNEAQRERRRKEREYDNTSLDEIMDRSYDRDNRW